MSGIGLDIGCSPRDYIEKIRTSYFHEVKNASGSLVARSMRGDFAESKSAIYWVASRTMEQYFMLFSMAGKMSDMDAESLLIDLLMPMEKVSNMQGSEDVEAFCKGVDEIYLAYSALRKKLNE